MVDKLPPVNLTKIDELLISFCIAPRHFIETFDGVCNLYKFLAYGGDIFLGQRIKNKLSAPRNWPTCHGLPQTLKTHSFPDVRLKADNI